MKSPRSLGTLGPQLMRSSNSQARSLFHLLANWFHLYLRKDKELCSGNVSLCSQALFLSSWWTGMEGMHLLAGIRWCPGNKWKSRSYPSSLCFGGKNHGGGGHSAGREGCRTSYLSFYKLLLVNGFQQWHLTRWAQKPGKWWRQSDQWEARETFTTSQQQACPGYILPKKGISQPTLLVRHSSMLIVMLGVPFASVSSQKAFQGKQVAKTGIKRTS